MSKRTTESIGKSSPEWDELEEWLRGSMQKLIQQVLEEEVTGFFGRAKSARRSEEDSNPGYRNGYAKPRKLTLSGGTIELRRPRVRNTDERFESRLLPLFAKRTAKVAELIPQLYLHGLSEGDFDLALRGLLGEDAPLSGATVARLKDRWNGELAQWRARRLDEQEVVYVWVDGVYVKAGFEREKAAVLVVIGALSDGSKTVLSIVPGYRESTESWSDVLRDLRDRGMNCPKLVVGDGHLGIWGALANVYPEAEEQRCWNHKIINVLDRLPKAHQEQAKLMLRSIPYAGSRAESERLKSVFAGWCRERSYDAAAETLERDWDRMVTFYDFPAEHWRHLRTTNVVESPFAALRLRTDAAKRFKRVDRAIAVIWKMLMVAESRFRRLKAPELMKDVHQGAIYKDGIIIESEPEKVAA
ncbi:MAG: IS256 family transposase [Chloroflexi bacterium]|nr:IS256 family transposase [Chloroflexota bacterium]